MIDRLIAVLGLGSVGRKVNSLRPIAGYFAYLVQYLAGSRTCPGDAGLVCTDIAQPHSMNYMIHKQRDLSIIICNSLYNNSNLVPQAEGFLIHDDHEDLVQ